jgi:hypothetical protein
MGGMSTKSRNRMYGVSVRTAAQRAAAARKEADKLACEAWDKRMLGLRGPAQPSPTLGDALNAGYCYLEVRCLGCDTHQTVPLDIIRRPKRPSTSLSGICAAGIARNSGAIPTSAVIWSRHHQDLGERSAINMVARGTMSANPPQAAVLLRRHCEEAGKKGGNRLPVPVTCAILLP